MEFPETAEDQVTCTIGLEEPCEVQIELFYYYCGYDLSLITPEMELPSFYLEIVRPGQTLEVIDIEQSELIQMLQDDFGITYELIGVTLQRVDALFSVSATDQSLTGTKL